MCDPTEYFFDYYRLPGRWYNVKYAVYYWFFGALKKILRVFNVHTKHGKPENNDGPHALNDDTIGYDATWIGGTTSDGKWIVLALDRRNDWKTSIGYVRLQIPGVGRLATPTYPKSVDNTQGNSVNDFALDKYGLKMKTPLREWSIDFEGTMMYLDEPGKSANVKITARWTSTHDEWLLNRDLSTESFADSFARENWSKFIMPLLDRSKDNVVHWEQFGRLDATVELDGKTTKIHDAMTVRDRSFGRIRDFTAMHRYFYVTMFLANGRSLVIAVVCHKVTFSRLFFGFVGNSDGTCTSVDWSDLNIHQFGENGRVTGELCFLIKIDKLVHAVQIVCDGRPRWYRLENGVVRCEQLGECLFDDQPGKCMVQSLYSESSLSAKTFCRPLTFLDDNNTVGVDHEN